MAFVLWRQAVVDQLPREHGGLDVQHARVVLSALREAQGGDIGIGVAHDIQGIAIPEARERGAAAGGGTELRDDPGRMPGHGIVPAFVSHADRTDLLSRLLRQHRGRGHVPQQSSEVLVAKGRGRLRGFGLRSLGVQGPGLRSFSLRALELRDFELWDRSLHGLGLHDRRLRRMTQVRLPRGRGPFGPSAEWPLAASGLGTGAQESLDHSESIEIGLK